MVVTLNHRDKYPLLTWLRGFQDKCLYLVLFSLYPSLLGTERQKKLKNLLFLPERLLAMLEYRGYYMPAREFYL